jgi:hypothetical protein
VERGRAGKWPPLCTRQPLPALLYRHRPSERVGTRRSRWWTFNRRDGGHGSWVQQTASSACLHATCNKLHTYYRRALLRIPPGRQALQGHGWEDFEKGASTPTTICGRPLHLKTRWRQWLFARCPWRAGVERDMGGNRRGGGVPYILRSTLTGSSKRVPMYKANVHANGPGFLHEHVLYHSE